MFACVEPPHSYVRDTSASVVHHADYLARRETHALCGATLENAATLPQPGAADAICPDCQEKLVFYHLEWWRGQALAATAELEALRAQHGRLEESVPSQVVREVGPNDDPADTGPTTLLDRARRELADLCRQFDGDVPYVRLKNAMQAFSDRLESHERLVLAQEIGGDGSLMRWSTTAVKTLGLQVANNPVQDEPDPMWEEWIQDSYQAPKQPKRRFGRSR
jgi:hypothetical protein